MNLQKIEGDSGAICKLLKLKADDEELVCCQEGRRCICSMGWNCNVLDQAATTISGQQAR